MTRCGKPLRRVGAQCLGVPVSRQPGVFAHAGILFDEPAAQDLADVTTMRRTSVPSAASATAG